MMWVGEIAHSLGAKIIQMGKGEMNLFNKYWEESGTHMQTTDAGPKYYYTQTVPLTLDSAILWGIKITEYCQEWKKKQPTKCKKIFGKYLVRD